MMDWGSVLFFLSVLMVMLVLGIALYGWPQRAAKTLDHGGYIMHIPDMLTEKRNDPSMMAALFPATSIGPDYADLERRVADLEDRAHRQDAADASKRRLKEMGLVFPSGESLK